MATIKTGDGKEIEVGDPNLISDGYHTFGELYEHRIALYIALARMVRKYGPKDVWMSERHGDGSRFDGWFVLGIGDKVGQQITYHLPMRRWEECSEFAEMLGRAPEYDGHTSAGVLERLRQL